MNNKKQQPERIALFTDFGAEGPYLGQVKAVLLAAGITVPIIDLLSNAPCFNPRAGAYLLASLAEQFPEHTLFLCVVDPGVGGGRLPLVVQTPSHWFVGPDNGLCSQVVNRFPESEVKTIEWRPPRLSATFHGRDLFAPVAAMLCRDEPVAGKSIDSAETVGNAWPEELFEVIYLDHFGNCMTGIRAATLTQDQMLELNGRRIGMGRTFADMPPGTPFWYENSIGLVEIAVNQGRACERLDLEIGTPVAVWEREAALRKEPKS
jgi:S-adenosylmethionine hydrolase